MAWLIPDRIPLPEGFLGFDPENQFTEDFDAYERHLPHWRAPGRSYFVTFRLRDSIPIDVQTGIKAEAKAWQKRLTEAIALQGNKLREEWAAWRKFQQVQMRRLELILDEGRGECLLDSPQCRMPLIEALHHFEGTRCEMLAYAIMPNHVHVLCRPQGKYSLESLCRSWKRHSADRIHRMLGRSGSLWQEESFDRIIRDGDHYIRTVRYISKNPSKAGIDPSRAVVWLHPSIVAANSSTYAGWVWRRRLWSAQHLPRQTIRLLGGSTAMWTFARPRPSRIVRR